MRGGARLERYLEASLVAIARGTVRSQRPNTRARQDTHGERKMSAGPPGQRLTKDISHMAYRSGWTVRPVLWWFQATHSGSRVLHQALTPVPLRRWPARRFWGGCCIRSGIAWASVLWSPSSARWIGTRS